MLGPGRYDLLCTQVHEEAQAAGVIIIVIAGKHGSGMSVQAPIDIQVGLPSILRNVAHQIEADFTSYGNAPGA